MSEDEKAAGMSAFERDVRHRLAQNEQAGDLEQLYLPVGVLRGLVKDLETLRALYAAASGR